MENRYITAEPNKCCGCGACNIVCPVKAIKMVEDEFGFIMPDVDHALCISCGKCRKICNFISSEKYISKSLPLESYAAVNKNEILLKKSASGGVFSGIAHYFLENGGVVYGAAMKKDFSVKHIGIDSEAKLHFLQGSKYTQSDTSDIFAPVKKQLKEGKKVLFTGTPCQVAAIKSFLGKDYDNLYTMDLVCHGVGSNKMFKNDLDYLSEKYKSKIKMVSFRSKRRGWGTCGDLALENRIIDYTYSNSPYYYYYLDCSIFRDSCYCCPYATEKRVGDITVGDFWRINSLFPDLKLDTDKGVSCLIVNTKKGKELLLLVKKNFELIESNYNDIVIRNGQLSHASVARNRNVMELYKSGYSEFASYYYRNTKKFRFICKIKSFVPKKVKLLLKRTILK